MRRRALLALFLLPALVAATQARADEALWRLLKAGGQVVLMRHAVTTPGVGDPDGMVLHDCRTQRNLSDEGRAHARQVGEAFRARGVPVAQVLSSPWCRCLETARLAFGVSPEVSTALNNLFGRSDPQGEQVGRLRALVSSQPGVGQCGDGFARLHHPGADRRVARAGGDGDRHASGRRQICRCRTDGSSAVAMTVMPA